MILGEGGCYAVTTHHHRHYIQQMDLLVLRGEPRPELGLFYLTKNELYVEELWGTSEFKLKKTKWQRLKDWWFYP